MANHIKRLRVVRSVGGNLGVRVYRREDSGGSCYAVLDMGAGDLAIIDGSTMEELEERLWRELDVIAQSRELLREAG